MHERGSFPHARSLIDRNGRSDFEQLWMERRCEPNNGLSGIGRSKESK